MPTDALLTFGMLKSVCLMVAVEVQALEEEIRKELEQWPVLLVGRCLRGSEGCTPTLFDL